MHPGLFLSFLSKHFTYVYSDDDIVAVVTDWMDGEACCVPSSLVSSDDDDSNLQKPLQSTENGDCD